jgi:hypothetical protein
LVVERMMMRGLVFFFAKRGSQKKKAERSRRERTRMGRGRGKKKKRKYDDGF